MGTSIHTKSILNSTIQSLKSVIPIEMNILSPSILPQSFEQKELSVLISIIGDIKGRIILEASSDCFASIGSNMFGLPLTWEMLESFTGELGNMIAGNLCTLVGANNLEIDITPSTVIVGTSKLYGFRRAFKLPVEILEIGELTVILMIDE